MKKGPNGNNQKAQRAGRLWDKGEGLNAEVHRFTVGDDPINDLELVRWDAIGSAAQAKMLLKIGILNKAECETAIRLLSEVVSQADRGSFEIPSALEDCHTAIESFLTERGGDVGTKIHTGRSRNDQVLLASRLYVRNRLVSLLQQVARCALACSKRYDEVGTIPMPGYTHMQPAMPSSVGMWLNAYMEGFIENLRDGLLLLESIDSNPLGVGSGFGVPLPLDREYTAQLLGFSRVQRNPIDVQNSRGRNELKVARWCVDVGGQIEKLSWDMLLYSMREFGYFALPQEMTTGSSIMPQKHNPDVLELLRARVGLLRGAESELSQVIAKLPSSYHRDFQLTKGAIIRAVRNLGEMLPVIELVIQSFYVNREKLQASMSSELYVTYDAFRQVRAGTPFREAYRASASRAAKGEIDYEATKADFKEIQKTIDSGVQAARAELSEASKRLDSWSSKLAKVEADLLKS